MFDKKFAVAALISCLGLAACGDHGSATVSAESGDKNESSHTDLISKIKSIVTGKAETASVKVPVYTLIGDAILSESMPYEQPSDVVPIAMDADNFDWRAWADKLMTADQKTQDQAAPYIVSLIRKNAPKNEVEDAAGRMAFGAIFLACTGAQNGWPINPSTDMGGDAKVTNAFMQYTAASCGFASHVYQVIAEKVSPMDLADENVAREKILAEWHKMPPDSLKGLWDAEVKKYVGAPYSVDLAGAQGIHFQSGVNDFANANSGFVWSRNGAKWFGSNYIEGKIYEVSVASTLGAKVEKSHNVGDEQGTTTGTGSGNNVDVK